MDLTERCGCIASLRQKHITEDTARINHRLEARQFKEQKIVVRITVVCLCPQWVPRNDVSSHSMLVSVKMKRKPHPDVMKHSA